MQKLYVNRLTAIAAINQRVTLLAHRHFFHPIEADPNVPVVLAIAGY
jgi:hypothetical protein